MNVQVPRLIVYHQSLLLLVNVEIGNSVIEARKLKEFYSAECLHGFKNLDNQFKVSFHFYL